MNVHSDNPLRVGVLAAAILAAVALSACNKPGEATVGQKVDGAISGAKDLTEEASKASADAAEAMRLGAVDATITTKINAALAADDKLSALKIDVDTSEGRVTLNGAAPDTASRDRATVLATAVEGVVSVDNKLAVSGS